MNKNHPDGGDKTRSFTPVNPENKKNQTGRPGVPGQANYANRSQTNRRPRQRPDEPNNRTQVMGTVNPKKDAKTIYRKDTPPAGSDQTRVMNTTPSGGSAQKPRAAGGNQTRVMNTTPSGGRAPKPRSAGGNQTRAMTSRGGQKQTLSARPVRRQPGGGYRDGGEAVTGTLTSVMKAIIYIVFVLITSGFLSYFGISVFNDVFAFVKPDDEIDIIIPEYATINDISEILKDNDVIRYPSIFKLYAKLRRDSGEYLAGAYTVTPSMDYDMLLSDFKPKKKPRAEVSITIPEGYSVDQIIELFTSRDMGTREGFIEVIENGDFSKYNLNWFIAETEADRNSDRKYRLEGYLFPDTYYFYSDSNEYTIIYKMLQNFYNKFDESYKARCEELGYTVDEVIVLASMIQAEAKYPSEYSSVSSVFHNRLNNPSGPTQGRLESDPTIQYMMEDPKTIPEGADTEIDHPYNTYIIKGLPPGPICNPSLNAIQYALYPAETDYLYFVAQTNGYHLFAATHEEHIMNIIAARGG
ncbi:MAG: endolytic transglycosylase MltG [Eubacteriales bacterium]|nr:endolytic transglycosylase MltG [Eubacteriales bacterium]